ncbi:hypothetical protein HK100_005103 [Physocladia obscura]|uniref:Uncharacterized protein n=1 Tax=Physocladia obscura TaxID=109957 RepID=A0AAD5XC45_9FUNG|nr:hypothetical protein HK100_005103 [Physocladia obscura]
MGDVAAMANDEFLKYTAAEHARKVDELREKFRITTEFAEVALEGSDGNQEKAAEGIARILERRRVAKEEAGRLKRLGKPTELKASEGGRGFFFATDRKLKSVAIAVGLVLAVSWTVQWVAYALPYWKGDSYHDAGFFQVCGIVDFGYDPVKNNLVVANRYPRICESVETYADRFIPIFNNYTQSYPQAQEWQRNAQYAIKLIVASRWLEGLSTAADMFFGLFALYFVVHPSRDDRRNARNWYYAIAGIALAPLLCIIDSAMSFSNFLNLGIGVFNYNTQEYFYFSGDAIYVCTGLDTFVQYFFLYWGSKYQFKISKEIRLREEQAQAIELQQAETGEIGISTQDSDGEVGVIEIKTDPRSNTLSNGNEELREN